MKCTTSASAGQSPTCPNRGGTAFDEDGDCTSCREPGVAKVKTQDVVPCDTFPKTQQVAQPFADGTKGCAAETSFPDTTSYACWVNQRPCEVTALFSQRFDGDLAVAMERADDYLPCQRCRAKKANAEKLLHLRLGRRDRHVLLNAPGWDGDSKVVAAPEPGRAADEANRRAIRKLSAAGLVWIGRKRVEVKTVPENCYERTVARDYLKRCVWLTPLGEIVIRVMRDALAAGSLIRWARFIPQILAAASQRDAHKLLEEFRDSISKEQDRRQQLARYVAIGASMGGNAVFCRNEIAECIAFVESYGKILKAIGSTDQDLAEQAGEEEAQG